MSAPTGSARTERRLVAPIAAAALVLLVALGTPAALNQAGLFGVNTPATKVVPFASLPVPARVAPAAPQPRAPKEASAKLPKCKARDLEAAAVRQVGNAAGVLLEPALRNAGPDCALRSDAKAFLVDAEGKKLSGLKPEKGRGATTVTVMEVPAGGEVRVRLIATGASCKRLPRTGLQLSANVNDEADKGFKAKPLDCDEETAEDQFTIGPWLPQLPKEYLGEAPAPPAPRITSDDVTLVINNVQATEPGGVVKFDVTMQSTSASNIALDPCPEYRMFLIQDDIGTQEYMRLNCEEAPDQLSVGEAVTFRMEMRTSPDVVTGTLGWDLGQTGTDDTPKARFEYTSQ